jgi:hypothetical protein
MVFWVFWQKSRRTAIATGTIVATLFLSTPVPGSAHSGSSPDRDPRGSARPSNLLHLSQQTPSPLQQVNSVSDLSDVRPTDWAFAALQSLAQRYNCLLAYPDNRYQGDRSLTRYEFAAGLNLCLNRIAESIGNSGADLEGEDLSRIRRLQAEFSSELATLRGRVDALEIRTDSLAANQFSATTQLVGEASFFLSGALGDEKANDSGESVQENTTLDYRSRLIFNTSFTGKDLLKTFLVSANSARLGGEVTGTNMTRLAFDVNTNGSVILGKTFYRFPVGDNWRVNVDAVGGGFNANVPTFNEFFTPEITGALSRFGRFNPIYRQGLGGSGLTLTYSPNSAISLSLGYLAPDASEPTGGNGLFDGRFAALGQVAFKPSDRFRVGVTYVRSYAPGSQVAVSGAIGSQLANRPFGETATSADHFGVQTSVGIGSHLILGGWAGLTLARAEDKGVGVRQGDDATIFNWAVTLAAPNLDDRGSRAGIVLGQPPKVTDNDGGESDEDTSFHFEGFYRYQIAPGIAIEPGFLAIVNPEHDADNDAIWIGNLRTIFLF